MTYKPYIAAAVLLFTCVVATYASVERFSFAPQSVDVPGTQYPDAWVQTSSRERLSVAAKTQTARYPSRVP